MQKFLSCLFLLIFVFFLDSCSSPLESNEAEDHTLRKMALDLDTATIWTSELEGNILSSEIKNAEGFDKSLLASPRTFALSYSARKTDPLYPKLANFYPLDLSNMDAAAKSLLTSFCQALVDKKNTDSFFSPSDLYNLIVFNYSLFKYFGKSPSFSSYLAGRPLLDEKIYQCPVRLFYDQGKHYLDIFVYLKKTGATWKVQQIASRESEKEIKDEK